MTFQGISTFLSQLEHLVLQVASVVLLVICIAEWSGSTFAHCANPRRPSMAVPSRRSVAGSRERTGNTSALALRGDSGSVLSKRRPTRDRFQLQPFPIIAAFHASDVSSTSSDERHT